MHLQSNPILQRESKNDTVTLPWIQTAMNAANENHIKLLTRPELELDSLKLSIDKADKECV